jgi:DNA primase
VQLLETIVAYPTITKAALLERWRDREHFGYLQRLSVDPFLRDIPPEGIAAELTGALNRLSDEVLKDERRRPLNQPSTGDWTEEVRAQLDREAAAARTRHR